MVELNQRERAIKVKIVYYGPAVGGKTTNLQVLHQHAAVHRRGELVSIASAQDRTILFDLLPLATTGLRGFDLRIQVIAVPGQAMYSATRRLVLKGVDSLVFVANSAADRWEDNVQSFREMTENLIAHQLDPQNLPLILQYNKRDLPDVTPFEFMDRTLNARKVEAFPAVAVRGEGVLETFSAVLTRTIADLARRYNLLGAARGGRNVEEWTEHTMHTLFGGTSLFTIGGAAAEAAAPMEAAPPPRVPAPERRTVRIDLPEEAVRRAGMTPDARANESLVESYAAVAERLGQELASVREERDVARRRLAEIRQAQAAAQDVLAGRPLESALPAVLGPMASTAGSLHASFLLPTVDTTLRVGCLRNLADEPVLRTAAGQRFASERLLAHLEPRLYRGSDSPDLDTAFSFPPAQFATVVAVPVRTPRGLHALGMLYYSPDDSLPGPDVLDHLGALGTSLSASLEIAAALENARQAQRTLQLALVGSASLQGMEDAVMSLMAIRDRLGAMRLRSDLPPWFPQELARLTPCLSGALGTGRSVLAFGRGEIQGELVDLDDVVAELRATGVDVHVGQGASTVTGDAVLVRLAVLALLEHARASNGGTPRFVAVADSGRVKMRVSLGPVPSTEASVGERFTGPNLRLAFVQKVAQLHGGLLSTELDQGGALWATLSLPS